ncbi:MAG TPA: PP2C family serine/threonine-protein phosphatase [Polyangiales bacterium]
MSLPRIAYGRTDIGKRRSSNEDAFLVDDALGLYVVADGMGGHSSGEVASAAAVEVLHGMVQRERENLSALLQLPRDSSVQPGSMPPVMHKALRILESAVQAATYMVFGLSEANPEQRGMGTTLSALLLGGEFALTAQVGDSRVYMVRDGQTAQITEDHTLIAWQLKKGLITPEEARVSRQKNVITRAVGSRDYVQVDTNLVVIQRGDAFLLCSDGLHGYVTDPEIATLLQLPPPDATEQLIQLANQRGGRDNITSVAVRLA